MAEVILRSGAAEELEELPKVIHGRVLKLLELLKEWPEVSGAKALSGDLTGQFRLRTGNYRLQFRLDGERVIVEKIGHRDGFYED